MSDVLREQLKGPIDFVRQQLAATKTPKQAPPAVRVDAQGNGAALMVEVKRVMREWRESAEGKALRASYRSMTARQIQDHLDRLVRSPRFDQVRALSLGGILDGLIPQSISIGLAGELELFLGVYGSIGYVADLSLDSGSSGFYFLGAFAEGLAASGDLAEQVGFWLDKVADINGSYIGGEIEVDEGLGLAGFALLKKDVPKALLIEVTEGIGDGASGLEFYMWTHANTHGPQAQSEKSHMLILEKVYCNDTSEMGHDEVYLTFTVDGDSKTVYRYPTWNYYSMGKDSTDQTWNLGRSIWLDDYAEIQFWDEDDTSSDDKIAYFKISVASFSGVGAAHAQVLTNGQSGGKYTLTAYLMDLNQ